MAEHSSQSQRRLTFASGGWVLVLALLLGLAFLVTVLLAARAGRRAEKSDAQGGAGFDLTTCLVARERIADTGIGKSRFPTLDQPEFFTPADADALTISPRNKYLVGSDRVIGLSVGRDQRAYPLRVLVWHEVLNDVVGGLPVAVTYNALSDTAIVFDRRVGNETLDFGVSGLLYNSTLLVYDRRLSWRDESLWSPLQGRAVSGIAASSNQTLTILPSTVLRWQEWRTLHPETSVIKPAPAMEEKYQSDPYSMYFGSDLLRFPVDPMPPEGSRSVKTPLTIVRRHDGSLIDCDQGDTACTSQGEAIAQTLWFAWYSVGRPEARSRE